MSTHAGSRERELPYAEDPGQTHWHGCFRAKGHHNCAVVMADELAEEVRAWSLHGTFLWAHGFRVLPSMSALKRYDAGTPRDEDEGIQEGGEG